MVSRRTRNFYATESNGYQFIFDRTGKIVHVGDEDVFGGCQGHANLPIEELSDLLGNIGIKLVEFELPTRVEDSFSRASLRAYSSERVGETRQIRKIANRHIKPYVPLNRKAAARLKKVAQEEEDDRDDE